MTYVIDYVMSIANCRGSWVVGRSRGSWVWAKSWVWVKVVGNKKHLLETSPSNE